MTTTQHHLHRRAAAAGPGYLGARAHLSLQNRQGLLREFKEAGQDPPDYLENPHEWIEREAKLFEAGDFPDKGVTITPADLSAMEAQFDLPVPVLIEHAQNPLELGYLTAVRADGDELFGTIALTPEADALIRRCGAKSLSLGLTSDLKAIKEVSLVQNPRISDAQLFRSGHLLRPMSGEAHASKCVQEGRLLPSQAPFVRALLECPKSVDFDGSMRPVRELVMEFLDRMPLLKLYGALVPSHPEPCTLTNEELEFYGRYFPGLKPEDILQHR
ncbi:MAG: hypothetical protein IT205_08520 [Fimbriimonadaceae bacterium]|nr:hypothetical protein [Fimbriimonadaceae bacterium]